MSEPLKVAFLWHMHQPYYLDDPTGEIALPWVRLHAIKAYYDMNRMLERHPEMGCTINVVPSLLAQIKAYEERPDINDNFLNLSRKPARELTDQERKFILQFFFMSSWDTMVRPYPGYERLLNRRGVGASDEAIDRALKIFTSQDFLDLQTWFNLTWFGFSAAREENLAVFHEKGMGFTETEKNLVLDKQLEIMRRVIPAWQKLRTRGNVEISTTPFYHPILPILMGTSVVRRSMPHVRLPGEFSFPEDARHQINKGVAYYRETFGEPPIGMWPSEGSVCPELIPLWAEAGLQWVATDETILFRSLAGNAPRRSLYEPYRAAHAGAEIAVFFRDRSLSDLIGFTYSKNDPTTAVQDFLGHLGRIAEAAPGGTVSVILDGENPWEYYPGGGEDFLNRLYTALVEDPRFRPVSLGQALAESPARQTVANLYSGSWINADYRIWIGGPEENQGWSLVDRVRSHLESHRQSGKASAAQLTAATEQLYQAEGSDWFWWFDDDFNSDNDADFDRLFRRKLANVYLALGEEAPVFLDEAIHVDKAALLVKMPLALLHPAIDGEITHFYEWADAGFVDLTKSRGSMHLARSLLHQLLFGFDAEKFYLRLDPAEQLYHYTEGLHVRVSLEGRLTRQLRFPLHFGRRQLTHYDIFAPDENSEWRSIGQHREISCGEIIELAVPLSFIQSAAGEQLKFVVAIMKDNVEEDRFPKNGRVGVPIPDGNYDSINWSV